MKSIFKLLKQLRKFLFKRSLLKSLLFDHIIIIDEKGRFRNDLEKIVNNLFLGVVLQVRRHKVPICILYDREVYTVSLISLVDK